MNTLFDDNTTGVNHSGNHANDPIKYLTSSSIIGDKIYNPEGEDLGKIKDIMLNIHDGTVEYVIIEFGGFLGMGGKYFAVPFKALSLDVVRCAFIFLQTREELLSAPGFDKDHWPETNIHVRSFDPVSWGGFMGPNTGSKY